MIDYLSLSYEPITFYPSLTICHINSCGKSYAFFLCYYFFFFFCIEICCGLPFLNQTISLFTWEQQIEQDQKLGFRNENWQ